MPTENRSSNTEMAAKLSPCPFCGQQDAFVEQLDSDASVVICQGRIDEHSACLARGPVGVQQHECEDQPGHDQAVKEWNKRAAAAPHPDPIAWMVGTAIWWTKEEAERDAAATELPIVGLGPMTDTGEVERLVAANTEYARRHLEQQGEAEQLRIEMAQCATMAAMVYAREWAEHVGSGPISSKVEAAITQLHNDIHEANEKLVERDALLREIADHCNGCVMPTEQLLRDWGSSIDAALSASAEPQVKS
ncbi:Lar family restriction alleviation protein [Pseudomonas urmiensis]|uniref:Lar family restriction alleviation protein n=1 Tax=Pseudomonas urmiensis TaxID=2745493 RepID=A0A923JWP1_9PSED|nr:Lar family restriction alleviation protein [Pseudomonas urmiensis]MBV4536914.1 Lar family restriction alleviation protein [Pseudomonas urmiensis]